MSKEKILLCGMDELKTKIKIQGERKKKEFKDKIFTMIEYILLNVSIEEATFNINYGDSKIKFTVVKKNE